MPNRMLRDWTSSERINSLSVHGERFFVRIIMIVDDYGRFHADPRLLKANLFPLLLDSIRDADILRWTAECEKAGLIVVYENSGKRYLQIENFKQRLRQMNEKYPPPSVSQMTVNCQSDDRTKEVEGSRRKEGIAPDFDLKESNLFRKPNIPTKQQVLETFVNQGGTQEMAGAFWRKHDGTGWYLNGSPIQNYVSLAQSFIRNWNKNKEQSSSGSQPSAPPLKPIQHD